MYCDCTSYFCMFGNMFQNVYFFVYLFSEMQEDFNKNEMTLNQLADDIDELNRNMTIYLQVITKKSREYYKCKT